MPYISMSIQNPIIVPERVDSLDQSMQAVH